MKRTLPFPRLRRGAANQGPAARARPSRRTLLTALALLAALSAGLYAWRARPDPAAAQILVPVSRGDLSVTVESSGAATPAQQRELAFSLSGQIAEVLVTAGQRVTKGQPLARLDDRELQLEVQRAEANLQATQAQLDQAQGGATTPQDIAAAEANLRAARAALQRARAGTTSAADTRQVEASLAAAQAQLDALRNPTADKVSAADLRHAQAQATLDKTRDSASAAKTRAQLDMQRATQALTQAQSAYSTALQHWQHVQDSGTDPISPTTAGAQGQRTPNRLNDAQRQQYYDAFVQAEAALHSAETAVQQAQVAYDSARQQESADVAQAEAELADAEQQREAVTHPSRSDLAQAQSAVASAQATLDRLRRDTGAPDVAAAQAQVDSARAALEKLTAPAAAASVAAAQAGVAQAEAQLASARLKLEQATLRAPFGGLVAAVDAQPGASIDSDSAVTMIDDGSWHLDVELNEIDLARVAVGQPVEIVLDTFPDETLTGTVESVATIASSSDGVVTYAARVSFDPGAIAVRSGMSASATITVETHKNVIRVPSNAISVLGPISTVQVRYGDATATVQVETGATDGVMTEIVSCPEIGKQCLREGDQLKLDLSGAAPGGPGGERTFFSGPAMKGAGPIKIERVEGP
jgi:HlyD family secretion protein